MYRMIKKTCIRVKRDAKGPKIGLLGVFRGPREEYPKRA